MIDPPSTGALRGDGVPAAAPGEVRRAELLAILADPRPLTVLTAPSGYGKTTALGQLARAHQGQVVWIHLDEEDADPRHLAARLLRAVDAVGAAPVDASAAPSVLADHLAQHLRATASPLLILDEIERLSADTGRWLLRLTGAVPDCRVVLSGRHADALGLAHLAATGQARLLGDEHLAFTRAETAALFEQRSCVQDDQEAHERLNGWPVGLALVASGAAPHLDPADLITEALRGVRADVRASLHEAAILPVWDDQQLRHLGCHLPPDWLDVLRDAGLPVSPLGQGRYRPHRLLLERLEQCLARTPHRRQELHVHAAHLAEQRGEWLAAQGHYLAAQCEHDALRVTHLLVAQLAAGRNQQLLRRVLQALPAPLLDSHLASLLAFSLIETGEAAAGEATLRAVTLDDPQNVWVLCVRSVLAGRWSQHEQQLTLADAGLALAVDPAPRLSLLKSRCVALLNLGRYAEGTDAARMVVAEAEQQCDVSRLGDSLTILQFALLTQGAWAEREDVIRRALELHRSLQQPLHALPHQTDLADIYRARGESGQAQAMIDAAMTVAAAHPSAHLAYLREVQADLHFWQRDFQQAAQAYQDALDLCGQYSVVMIAARLWLKLSDAASHLPDPVLAEDARLKGRALAQSAPRWIEPFVALRDGQRALTAGHLEEARVHLMQAATGSLERTHQARAAALLAEVAQRLGAGSSDAIETLFAALDALGTDDVLLADRELLPHLLTAGDLTAAQRRRLHAVVRPAPSATLDALRVATLGGVRITFRDQPVKLNLSKAVELLVWLALNGAASRDRIVDALWDGSNDQRHLDYFRVAVKRLREGLTAACGYSASPVLFEHGQYALADHVHVDLDLNCLRRALEDREPAQLQGALALCRGDFAPEFYAEWAEEVRFKARDMAVTVALALGAQSEHHDPKQAMNAYRRATELDAFSETGYSSLIRLHRTLGNTTEAAQVYESYARHRRDALDIDPPGTGLFLDHA